VKKLISKIRQITWKQWSVIALYTVTFYAVWQAGEYVVGLMAEDKTSSIPAAAEYGFGLGIFFGFFLLALHDSFTRTARRYERKTSDPVAE
jgi:hypothetical protein